MLEIEICLGKNRLLWLFNVRRRQRKAKNHVLGVNLEGSLYTTQRDTVNTRKNERFKIFNICIYVCEPICLLLCVLIEKCIWMPDLLLKI